MAKDGFFSYSQPMRFMANILQVFILFGLPQIAIADTCYPYEPEKVILQGALSQEAFPGRPNYESIEDGDEAETYYFLNLQPPICTVASENDDLYESASSVSKIQLVFTDDSPVMYKKLKPRLNTQIKCSGTLFFWHTGHHHTPVLMETKDCGPVTNK